MNVEQVINDNQGLVVSVANKLYRKNKLYSRGDLEQIGYLSLAKSLHKYDESRGKLSTFMVTCIKNDMLKFMKKNKLQNQSFPETETYKSIEDMSIISDYETNDPVYNEVLRRKYNGESNKSICSTMNISKSKLKKIIDSIKQRILE